MTLKKAPVQKEGADQSLQPADITGIKTDLSLQNVDNKKQIPLQGTAVDEPITGPLVLEIGFKKLSIGDDQIKYTDTDEDWGFIINPEQITFTDGNGNSVGYTQIAPKNLTIGNSNFVGGISASLLTVNRTYELPNKDGTFALLDDLYNKVDKVAGKELAYPDTHLEDLAFSGTFSEDVRTFSSYRLNLTGNSTISATIGTNLPNSTSKVVNLIVTSATKTETFAIPASFNQYGTYDPAVRNMVTISITKDGSGNLEHDVFINQPD